MDLYNPPIGDTDVNMQVDAPRTKRGFDDMQTGDTSLAVASAPKKLADESTVEALQAANIDSAAQVTVPASLSADSNLLQGLVFEDIPLPHSVLSRDVQIQLAQKLASVFEQRLQQEKQFLVQAFNERMLELETTISTLRSAMGQPKTESDTPFYVASQLMNLTGGTGPSTPAAGARRATDAHSSSSRRSQRSRKPKTLNADETVPDEVADGMDIVDDTQLDDDDGDAVVDEEDADGTSSDYEDQGPPKIKNRGVANRKHQLKVDGLAVPGHEGLIQSTPKPRTPADRKRRGYLSEEAVATLRQWLWDHLDNPYPSEEDKNDLSDQLGLSMTQVNNWFTNARRRNVTKMRDQKAKNPGAAPPHSPVAAPTASGLPLSTGVAVALPPAFTVPSLNTQTHETAQPDLLQNHGLPMPALNEPVAVDQQQVLMHQLHLLLQHSTDPNVGTVAAPPGL